VSPFDVRTIVFPTDFSPPSAAAAKVAQGIAERFGARVEVVHAWMPATTVLLDAAYLPSPSDVIAATERFEKQLREAADALGLPRDRVQRHLLQGPPWSVIPELAISTHAELIVMGTHGRSGLPHLLMGSVAERVVRSSRVPVLVVPPER
jgi:nucleotide-binding universal stress UspA family protein